MDKMSDSIFRIWSIARYEAKVIMRGWTFRTAFLLPLAFLAVFLLSSVFHNMHAISLIMGFYSNHTTTPWIMTILYSVYSGIVLAAVATNSAWLEWKLITLDGARVRPWTNVDYAIGKLVGQFIPFLIMTVSVMVFVIGINFFSLEMTVFTAGYLLYPLIIWVPAFFFIAGLSMFVSRIVRNQMVSLLIVTASVLFSVAMADRYFHLFDITAFRLPLLYSSITGFSFPELIAWQRLLYLTAGLVLVGLTAITSRRPPGRRLTPVAASVVTAVLLSISIYAGIQYADYFLTGEELRENIREASSLLRPVPRIVPLDYDISVDQEGRAIDCVVRVVLENRSGSPVDRYILTLNPGLNVSDVTSPSGEIGFERRLHILEVYPPESLQTGGKDTIEVRYDGIVECRAMFSDLPERIHSATLSFRDIFKMPFTGQGIFRVPRDLAPLRYDYMLLVPEAMWYPVPGLPYDPRYPEDDHVDFSGFRINVNPRAGLKAISQGMRSIGEDGSCRFEPEYPLKGITLAIGEFITRTIEIDSLEYSLWSTPGSENLIGMMESASDTLPDLIAYNRDKFEYSLGLTYPFRRFTVLEVPASFWPFNRPLRETGSGFVQPEIILVCERGSILGLSSLPVSLGHNRKYAEKRKRSLEEINRRSISFYLKNSLYGLCSDNRNNIFPMYYRQVTGIATSRYPYLGLLFEHMAGENVLNRERRRDFSSDGFTDGERASQMIMRGELFEAVMRSQDFRWAGNMIGYWAGHHYYLIDAASPEGTLEKFLRDLVESNRFRTIEETELLESFATEFGFRLESILIDLNDPVDIPGYVYSSFDCCKFVDGDRERFRLSFDVLNREGVGGVLVITAALKYPQAVRKAMKRKVKNPVVAVEALAPGESRRIEFVVDYKPLTVWIHTMISRNVPSRITWGPHLDVRSSCGGKRRGQWAVEMSDFKEGCVLVDDRDPEFEVVGGKGGGFLRRLVTGPDIESDRFEIRRLRRSPPARWSTIIHVGFFGTYIKSARCIRAGDGGSKAVWRAQIPEDGSYDVYCHILDPFRRYNERGRKEEGLDRVEHHYIVHHSDGSNEVVLLPDQCEDGWNLLGRYFFEEGEAIVELSDESPVLYVIADAVKWVKKD